jgi:dephospho-CoA kinase
MIMRRDSHLIIGIAGKTGSGKSTAAVYIKDNLGNALVIDVDKVAKDIYRIDPEVCAKISKGFSGCVSDKGKIDFSALAKKVFSDPHELEKLNRLMFPRIKKRVKEIIKDNPANILIIDAAVLFESGLDILCDYIVLVRAPKNKRLALLELDEPGKDPAELALRVEGQRLRDLPEKADYVLDNSEDLDSLYRKLDRIIGSIKKNGT